jgi:hypothetical protein
MLNIDDRLFLNFSTVANRAAGQMVGGTFVPVRSKSITSTTDF